MYHLDVYARKLGDVPNAFRPRSCYGYTMAMLPVGSRRFGV